MPIRVQCQSCKNTLQVPDSAEGKKAKCPSCQTLVKVERSTPKTPSPPTIAAIPKAIALSPNVTDRIDVACTGCGKKLRVPSTAAGKVARCPDCKSTVLIPIVSTRQTQPLPIKPKAVGPVATTLPNFSNTSLSSASSNPQGDDSLWATTEMPSAGSFGGASTYSNPYASPAVYGNNSSGSSGRSRSTQYKIVGTVMRVWSALIILSCIARPIVIVFAIFSLPPGTSINYEVLSSAIFSTVSGIVIASAIAFMLIVGGNAFVNQSDLPKAKSAAIIMAIPCFGGCFFPVGIWACVLAFRDQASRDFD